MDVQKELAAVVMAALTDEEALFYASIDLMDHYGVEADPAPTLVDVAREAQGISMAIMQSSISDELRDQRVKSLLKKVAVVAKKDDSNVPAISDPIAERIESLGAVGE